MQATSRPAGTSDIAFLLAAMAMLRAEDGTEPLVRVEAEPALRGLLADPAFGCVRILEQGGVTVGYLVLTFGYGIESLGRNAFVDELFVLPAFRRRGIGTRALKMAERICAEVGARTLYLEVERANTRARELYRRVGFRERDRMLMSKRIEERGEAG